MIKNNIIKITRIFKNKYSFGTAALNYNRERPITQEYNEGIRVTQQANTYMANVENIDLKVLPQIAKSESKMLFNQIHQALLNYKVICIKNQSLSEQDLITFTNNFGNPMSYHLAQYSNSVQPFIGNVSNMVSKEGKSIGLKVGKYWHSDLTFDQTPNLLTILYGVVLPDVGGNTLYTDLVASWKTLPQNLKNKIQGKKASHKYIWRYKGNMELMKKIMSEQQIQEQMNKAPSWHPAVRTHHITGEQAIYINPGFTQQIEGYTFEDSQKIVAEIWSHCMQEEYRYDHIWTKGDLLIWDNSRVAHMATTDDLPPEKQRLMWRTIIEGPIPE